MNQLELVNSALGRLGVDPIGNINDTTKAAKSARLHWPIALSAVLRSDKWNSMHSSTDNLTPLSNLTWKPETAYATGAFVVASNILMKCARGGITGTVEPTAFRAGVADGTATWDAFGEIPIGKFGYANVFLYPENALKILSVGTSDYRVYGRAVYTNELAPVVEYISVAASPEALDPLLQEAVRARLAMLMAPSFGQGNIIGDLLQEYEYARREAERASSDEALQDAEPEKFWTESI